MKTTRRTRKADTGYRFVPSWEQVSSAVYLGERITVHEYRTHQHDMRANKPRQARIGTLVFEDESQARVWLFGNRKATLLGLPEGPAAWETVQAALQSDDRTVRMSAWAEFERLLTNLGQAA